MTVFILGLSLLTATMTSNFVLVILANSFQNAVNEVNAATSVQFIVENVFWGTPPNNVIIVNPGDINVPLTVIIRNNSSETLRGVLGELELYYPFTDYITESNVSKASGQPVESGDVFNQTGDILPSGSFTLTFQLSIDDDAKKGIYYANLTIYYNVKQNGVFVPGTPQLLRIEIRLPNRSPVIYSINPTAATVTVSVGQFVNFSCYASDPDEDNITYEWILDGDTVDYGQNYAFYATRENVGSHTLTVEVSDGNLTTSNSWTIIVAINPTTTIYVSTNYLFGGYLNEVIMNITNDVWVGRVQINLAAPQYLVVIGNSSWIINNVKQNDTVTVNLVIFAPETLIGQTMQVNLAISYPDNFGNTYTENYAIGFVIRGKIVLKVYGLITSPEKPSAGKKLSISGTILNVGNTKAMFTNVSIMPSPILDLDYESYSYIGDVDPNSPVPFTVTSFLKLGVSNGTYTVNLLIEYTDGLYSAHEMIVNVQITVINYPSTQGNEGSSGQSGLLSPGTIALIGSIIAIVAVGVVFYLRRQS